MWREHFFCEVVLLRSCALKTLGIKNLCNEFAVALTAETYSVLATQA